MSAHVPGKDTNNFGRNYTTRGDVTHCQRVRPGAALLEVRGLREEACPTSVGSLVAPRSHPLGGEDTSAWRERIEHWEDDNR